MQNTDSYITYLTGLIVSQQHPTLHVVVSLAIIALIAVLAYLLWSKLCVPLVGMIVSKTGTKWDDALLNPRVLRALGQLLPALIVSHWLPQVFMSHGDTVYVWLDRLTSVYIVWAVWFLLQRLLHSIYNKLIEDRLVNEHSSKGLLQMLIIIISCAAAIISVSICIGRSPIAILTALGATSAVLMLVFKDTILGLVAGVQLSANKMLKKGDWIIVDQAGANGEVQDVSLTTVKVLNWDESITTIPPYVLISSSFQNYANMRDGGGRRVMRSIYIDVNSVRFLTPDELRTLADSGLYDAAAGDMRVVNLTAFRHYLEGMLTAHPEVRADMRMMVRQLQPTPTGIPLELFFFVRQTEWTAFETVQSDIFDMVYAVLHSFGLRQYQHPAGIDLQSLASATTSTSTPCS